LAGRVEGSASASTGSRRTVITGLGEVDSDCPSVEFLLVEGLDGLVGSGSSNDGDKGESPHLASVSVGWKKDVGDFSAEGSEGFSEAIFRGAKTEVTNVKLGFFIGRCAIAGGGALIVGFGSLGGGRWRSGSVGAHCV